MRVGFTGTRDGLPDAQFVRFRMWIADHVQDITEFHHGCCIGADADAGVAVYDAYPSIEVIGHPSDMKQFTDLAVVTKLHEIREPKPPLDRNRDIVDETNVLCACPRDMQEVNRSGTWATVRFGRKQGKRVVIFWPDGKVTEEGGDK